MLDGLRDDVIALFAIHFRDTLDHQVVAFGRAARKNNFLRSRANQRSDLSAGIFHGFFAGPAERVVTACRIAELVAKIRQHRFQNARINRRRRMIVEINWQLHTHDSFSLSLQCHEHALLRLFAHVRNRYGSKHVQDAVVNPAQRRRIRLARSR